MTDRDPVVARALRDLRPPDHRPGFWDDVAREIDAGPDLRPAFTRPATSTNRMRWLAAAALVVVVAAVAVALGSDGGGDQTVTVAPATTTTTTTTTTATTLAVPAGPPPDEVVVAWLDAVGTGDIGAAAALTGPRSRANLPSLERMLQEAGEGFGAWVDSPDRSVTEVDVSDDLTVVIVSGTWTGEGETELRTDAFPVARGDDGGWLIEPWAYAVDRGPIDIVRPAAATGLAPDATIEVDDRGAGRYLFSLDDGAVVDNGADPVWDPPGEMTSQTHLLVVVHVDGDTIEARATTFLVEG